MGMKWRVGDGHSIWIYKDNWLLVKHGGRVLSTLANLSSSSLVVNLLDLINGG